MTNDFAIAWYIGIESTQLVIKNKRGQKGGETHTQAKLRQSEVDKIRELYSLKIGWTYTLLASKYKVSTICIRNIVTNRSWK